MSIIEIKKVSLNIGGVSILSNINFTVEKGDYVGIIGPNGGGKTTLIKVILGLITPQEGVVIRKWQKCAYVPQRVTEKTGNFPATVEEIVWSGRTSYISKGKRAKKNDFLAVNNALRISGIEEHRHRLVASLSGGERQKVFLARAVAGNPDIIILDEPSTGVDVAAQGKFYSLLEKLNSKGVTILFVSHDLDVVAHEAKSILCVNKVADCFGTPEEVMSEEMIEKLYGRKVKFFTHKH